MLRRNFCAIYQKENVFKCYASAQEKREKILEKRVRSSLLPLFIKGGKDEMTPTIWRFHLSLSLSIKHNGTKTAKQQSGEDNFLMVWRFFLSTSSLSTQSCSKGFPFLMKIHSVLKHKTIQNNLKWKNYKSLASEINDTAKKILVNFVTQCCDWPTCHITHMISWGRNSKK